MSKRSDILALRERFNTIMSIREGETEADARSRIEALRALALAERLPVLREQTRTANVKLMAHGVCAAERIIMLRQNLPGPARWLAAEVVHGRQPDEQNSFVFSGALNELW